MDLQKDNPQRAAYIEQINSGKLAVPYNKSINLNEANNVVVNGQLFSAASAVSSGLGDTTFFRLRDLAAAFQGTEAAFNVDWNGSVVLTRGGTYTGSALPDRTEGSAITYSTPTVLVDGKPVEITALYIEGNYYVSADTINTLLGTQATEQNGVLTLTVDLASDAGNGNAG